MPLTGIRIEYAQFEEYFKIGTNMMLGSSKNRWYIFIVYKPVSTLSVLHPGNVAHTEYQA